jgi:hypothetical protein
MKTVLESKIPLQFVRKCVNCTNSSIIQLPVITDSSSIALEHRFSYEDGLKIADVAHIDGEIKGIYEIYYTHKTCSEDRPEPWVEIDATTLLTSVNTKSEPFKIKCIRDEQCEKCSKLCYSCRGTGKWFDDGESTCFDCCCLECNKFKNECLCND